MLANITDIWCSPERQQCSASWSSRPLQLTHTNTNHLLTVAELNRSKLPTVWLHEFLQCPINPPQLTFSTCLTAQRLPPGVCIFVCMTKKICGQERGDGVSLCVSWCHYRAGISRKTRFSCFQFMWDEIKACLECRRKHLSGSISWKQHIKTANAL